MSGAPHGNPVQRLLAWLRTGYPHGIPQHDYIALFGILHRDLTDTEVEEIALALHQDGDGQNGHLSQERIRELITEAIREKPSDTDVKRVAARLADGGWPTAPPTAP